MDIYQTIQELSDRRSPQSTKEKTAFAKELVSLFRQVRTNSEVLKWVEGALLYNIKKHRLFDYVFGKHTTQSDFFEDIDIPPSTANTRINMWEFYVVKHGFSLERLKNADIFKLSRAIPYLKDADKQKVKDVVDEAKRGTVRRNDFIQNLKDGVQL